VSVVLPVFNGGPYLGEALESLLAQSLGDFELIAIDDGSTDGSRGVLEGFTARDSRLRVISRENSGHAATLNEGVLRATAAYVAIMDNDDIAAPERLEKQVAFLDAHPHVAAVGSQTYFSPKAGSQRLPPACHSHRTRFGPLMSGLRRSPIGR
jgi:glycosyltransferase involved in cell wall biosynthesis